MKVRQRKYPSGRVGWLVDLSGVTPDGQPFRTRFMAPEHVTSRRGAQRWGEEQRRRIERGEAPATPRAARKAAREREEKATARAEAEALAAATVAQAAAWWVEDGETDRLEPSTVDLRRRLCHDHVVPDLGDRAVRGLTDDDVREMKKRLAHYSPGFARTVIRALRGVVQAARGRGVPATLEVEIPPEPKRTPRVYDAPAFEAVAEQALGLGPKHRAVVLLTGEAGLRCGEVLGLQVVDALRARSLGSLKIERQRRRVGSAMLVRPPKGGKSRVVPLSQRCADALAALADERLAAGAALDAWLLMQVRFPDRPATESTVRDLLAAAQRAAGFEPVGPHANRATALTHMLASGSDVRTVQAVAGHGDIRTTAGYLAALPDQVAVAGDRVEAWRASAGAGPVLTAPTRRKRARGRARGAISAHSAAGGPSAALGDSGAGKGRKRPRPETPSSGS